jgi:hypothetical protein
MPSHFEAVIKNSLFPDMPRENPATDKEGNLMPLWELGLSALFQALQANFKDEGIVFPPLTAAQMTTIQNLYLQYILGTYRDLTLRLPDITGQTVFDKSTYFSNQFVIAVNADSPPEVILAEWVPFAFMKVWPGNPNGTVAGVLNWLCLDTTDVKLYACTLSGPIGVATWVQL